MKTVFLITARLKSTRLPNKLLREVCGRPIFAHMIGRLKLTNRVDEIVVCTSTNPQDDALEELAAQQGIGCFRGDEDDVIKRLADAATEHNADYALSITADCPFSDPVYAEKVINALETTGADLVRALDLPHGVYSYGIKVSALQKIIEIKDERETEVWGRYFTDTDLFKVYDLPIDNPKHRQPNLRMTLDYPEDLEFFQAVFAQLYQEGRVFSLDEILKLLDRHPEIVLINRHCASAYKKRWTRQSAIRLKPRYTLRRAAVIGCGSIGRRHILNLQQLGITEIVALRTRLNQRHSASIDGVLEFDDLRPLIDTKPDIAIVSNPTSLHLETINQLLPAVRGIFIEKPLSDSLVGVPELLRQLEKRRVVSFVGYNLQFHPAIRAIQDFAGRESLGDPILLQCQVGQWIEDWHPGRDYRQAYYARKDLGGGVSLSLIHEIHLAQELLGPASTVFCVLPRSRKLDLEVDTIADFTIEHLNGAVSQVHLDLLQRPAQRRGVISFERGWVDYDLIENRVTARTNGDARANEIWREVDFDENEPYLAEMTTFLNYVREGRVRHAHDAWQAAQSLTTVIAGFASAESKSAVDVSI